MKVHIVSLSSTVIHTAVSYDVFNSHYITLVFVLRDGQNKHFHVRNS